MEELDGDVVILVWCETPKACIINWVSWQQAMYNYQSRDELGEFLRTDFSGICIRQNRLDSGKQQIPSAEITSPYFNEVGGDDVISQISGGTLTSKIILPSLCRLRN